MTAQRIGTVGAAVGDLRIGAKGATVHADPAGMADAMADAPADAYFGAIPRIMDAPHPGGA